MNQKYEPMINASPVTSTPEGVTNIVVTKQSMTSCQDTMSGSRALQQQNDKTFVPSTSLSLSQVAKHGRRTLMPSIGEMFRSKEPCAVSAATRRSSSNSLSPYDSSMSVHPIGFKSMKNMSLAKTDTPLDVIPSGPLTVKKWTAPVGSLATKTSKDNSTEIHPDDVGSLQKTSTTVPRRHDQVERDVESLFYDQDSHVNEYLDKKYRECVLKGSSTCPTVPLVFEPKFCKRQDQQQQPHQDTLVAASLLSKDEPFVPLDQGIVASHVTETTLSSALSDFAYKEEELLSLLKHATSNQSEDKGNSNNEPMDAHVSKNLREAHDAAGKDAGRAMADMNISPPSPSGSGCSSSLETIEQDISDDYGPIDLTNADSDTLYETFFGWDPEIQLDPSTNTVEGAPLSFVFSDDETKGEFISRVSPDPSQTHHPFVYQQTKGTTSQDVDHLVPIFPDDFMPPSDLDKVPWHDCGDSLLNGNGADGQYLLPVLHPMGQLLNQCSTGGNVDTADSEYKQGSFMELDDEIIHWQWDFPQKDHWDFTGRMLLPRDVLTHPYQQHPQRQGLGSDISSDVRASFRPNFVTPINPKPFHILKKGGYEVVQVDSISGDRLVRAMTDSKDTPGTRKRQAKSGPRGSTTKKKRITKAIEDSDADAAGDSINLKNPPSKRKIPHRNTNEPQFSASHKRVWLKHYEDFREYVRLNGHGMVPHDHSKNKMLARWVKRQVRHGSSVTT